MVRRPRGVRGRSVLVAVAVVAAALLVGVVLLLVVLQRTLTADVEGEAMARAEDLAVVLRTEGPDRLPGVVLDTPRPEQVVQVDSTSVRSHGRALKRYELEVSAPTGQICTVLPLK